VRTTLTLEDDVAARLRAEARRTGRPFETLVNEALRAGLLQKRLSRPKQQFTIESHNFGGLRPGVSLDNIGELLERIEGPDYR
jgi:plasmid stability protein